MTLHDGSGDGEESTIVTTEDGILDGGPHRVVINKITNDSTAWEIYIDGELADSEVPQWNDEFAADNFDGFDALPTAVRLFDHDLDGDRGLEGVLDNVALFDQPLNESGVADDFEQQDWNDA